jgi:flagellar basal body L-ring protein FlgH
MMSRLRPSRKARLRATLALAFAAGLLAACSSASTIDMIPTAAGGLPANAPQRSATPPEYPAVNEMPQRREALPLTEDEVKRAKTDLTTLRTQQEERAGTLPKSADTAAKKDAEAAKTAKKAKGAKPATELTSAKDQNK